MHREKLNPMVYKIKPIVDKFTIPGGMDNANLEILMQEGFKYFIDKGIGKILLSNESYSLLMFPKIVPTLPYEGMLTLVPNTAKQTILSTMDKIEDDILTQILIQGNKARRTIIEVAQSDGHTVTQSYIFQHIGPIDNLPKAPYNTSYVPMHLHIHVYGPNIEQFPVFEREDKINFREREAKNLLRDPFIKIFQELLGIERLDVQVNERGALELSKNHINEEFNSNDILLLKKVISVWKSRRLEITSCATDFKLDENQRYELIDSDERLKRLDILFKRKDWSKLSERSKKQLRVLFKNLRSSKEVDPWHWIYKGIFGSIGYEFDHETNERKLLLVPQTFSSWYRHYRLVKSNIITRKDKINNVHADEKVADALLPIHRRVIEKM